MQSTGRPLANAKMIPEEVTVCRTDVSQAVTSQNRTSTSGV